MPLVEGLEGRAFEHSTLMLYARDAKNALQPNETQRNTLIVAGVYILVIGILWYVVSSALPTHTHTDIHVVHRHVPYLDRISEHIDP